MFYGGRTDCWIELRVSIDIGGESDLWILELIPSRKWKGESLEVGDRPWKKQKNGD